jgi:hypothetical protein
MAMAQTPPPATTRVPMLMPGKKSLYQRVITRPGATMASKPGAPDAKPTLGFTVYYVYARAPNPTAATESWVEVGQAADGRTQGWIPAAKTIDWEHAMIGVFTNPAGRQPVLFMADEMSAQRLILDMQAASAVKALREQIAAGHPGPVVATEPANFVDIRQNFYLLPILSAKLIERESGGAMRLLEVVSAPADRPATPPPPDKLANFKAAMVFVIDTTLSMQPYIDGTREAVKAVVAQIGGTVLKDKFRFGVVAYRDSLADTPDLEYPTRVYARPDFSQPPDAVIKAMADVKQATASSIGFDEDPIGGIKTALDDIDWSGLSAKYIVLITDSGARNAEHPHSITKLDITQIRDLAVSKEVQIMVVHLKTPEGARVHDHDKAAAQYSALAQGPHAESYYNPVANGSPDEFLKTVKFLVGSTLQNVAGLTGIPVSVLGAPPPPPGATPAEQERARRQMQIAGEAMRLAYLGQVEQTRAPDAVRSWTSDHDFANPTIPSLDVRVLLNRNQLSDLAHALQTILDTGMAGRSTPQNFFSQLRSVIAMGNSDPGRISQAGRIGDLLGEYLDNLPYKSEILEVTEEDWLAGGSIYQRTILNNVQRRLQLYQSFIAQTDLWIDITHSGRPGEAVYPVPIEALP